MATHVLSTTEQEIAALLEDCRVVSLKNKDAYGEEAIMRVGEGNLTQRRAQGLVNDWNHSNHRRESICVRECFRRAILGGTEQQHRRVPGEVAHGRVDVRV